MALKKSSKPVATKVSSSCCGSTSKSTSSKGCCDVSKMIQDRAYFIWESKGKPAGKDREFWLQAEKEIKAKLK
jgi:hypothetical protein